MSNKSEQAERRALAGSNNAVTLRAGDREPTTLHAMANLTRRWTEGSAKQIA